jgi:S1-C subfamily serine protease
MPAAQDGGASVSEDPTLATLRKSVVNFSCKIEERSPMRPWKLEPVQEIGGSGVVIGPGRILTNAHVVHQATEILVVTDQTALAVPAEIVAVDLFRDLALVKVDDADFIAKHPEAELLEGLPKDGARVTVMGYPMGGEALSTTTGVVSRSEWSDIGLLDESGMRVQVDAAVNFGNSGGPAFVDGRIAGLVFSGLDTAVADNISYLLATEEIRRFLAEAEAGTIDGNSQISVETQTLENPALRAKLGIDSSVSGVAVISAETGPLKPWDILTKIAGYPVDNKGQITIEDGRKVAMDCAAGRFVPADGSRELAVEILRDGKPLEVRVPAFTASEGIVRSRPNGAYPYLVWGPLAFGPVHQDLVSAFADEGTIGIYYFGNSPVLGALNSDKPANGKEFVAVLCPLMSHPCARGYDAVPGQTVKSVNGREFANFAEFVALMREVSKGKDEWITIEFHERGIERLVFRRADIEDATERVMDANGIRQQASKDVRSIWNAE